MGSEVSREGVAVMSSAKEIATARVAAITYGLSA